MIYFAFTSLATVGFGDFHPRADEERIFIAFLLVVGVAIFSYIMGIFISILKTHAAYMVAAYKLPCLISCFKKDS